MVSAVHLGGFAAHLPYWLASKGLHMVSAVHPATTIVFKQSDDRLQRGCTWLVQFITTASSQ